MTPFAAFAAPARRVVEGAPPAKTGCRYRYTKSDQQFWLSDPKRGMPKAYVYCGPFRQRDGSWRELWAPVSLAEALEQILDMYHADNRSHPQGSVLYRACLKVGHPAVAP